MEERGCPKGGIIPKASRSLSQRDNFKLENFTFTKEEIYFPNAIIK
jgi:hypothetical protein